MASDWALHRWRNLYNVLKVCYGDAYSRDAITEALDAAINLGHTEARCELGTALQEARAEGFNAGQLAMQERASTVSEDARQDEEYGHAAFRCVQIGDAIRALEPVEGGEEKTDV